MMQDFHDDDGYEDGPALVAGCWGGVVICLAVLLLMLAAGLLAG